jgi:cytochrome b subunit of formate dehydrogenase
MVALLGLVLTGLPIAYSNQPWAQRLARSLGGFATTSVWHRFFAVMMLVACGLHLLRAAGRIVVHRRRQCAWGRLLFGPDSPVPNARDARDMVGMVCWFFGLGPKPVFESWTYWEKFDYWAVGLMALLLGSTGVVLWFPGLVSLVFPGWTLNAAKVIHSDTALVVACLLLIVHFFNSHFRPEKFPMDLSLVTGLVGEEHLQAARPEFLERMRHEGRLADIRVRTPLYETIRPAIWGGMLVFGAGFILLLGVLWAALGK